MNAGFARSARVRARAEFDSVFKLGKRTASPSLALHWLRDDASPRLGLAVSRKVDRRAVGRNRIKRALREQFRVLAGHLPPGAYVIVARPPAAQMAGTGLRGEFLRLLTRAGALPQVLADGTMPGTPPVPNPPPGVSGA